MNVVPSSLSDVAELIHLAVAPIFLLMAVSTTLTVLIARLARIVDRGRALEAKTGGSELRRNELALLERRARMIYRALTLGVTAATLVCLLMTLAFVGELFRLKVARGVALLFLGSLFAYTGTLLTLLREVFLAVGGFRLEISPAQTRN